jgi:Radical SAM superfamily/4Fe-4S single cluster domain
MSATGGPFVTVELSTKDLATRDLAIKDRKFSDPDVTAKGEVRASVALDRLATLWINTGTLCNITCRNCYIESSPANDRLEYITTAEVTTYVDEIQTLDLGTGTIGYTGGEPFMNPDMLAILEATLQRGFHVLLLTNAMQPMQRPKIKAGLIELAARYGAKLRLRVSLDHFSRTLHETERGTKTWAKALDGLDWLAAHDFNIAIAGRTCWNETDAEARAGYAALITQRRWGIDAANRDDLLLLPEMDSVTDVPEITVACWGILKRSPSEMMCASSRMVVKRKGAATPTVLPCTLLPYDPAFEMGPTLAASLVADTGMFRRGAVKLAHVHCAKFCVLGGGSCS